MLAGEMGETELLHAGRIVPVYPLTAGLTAIRLRDGHPRGARQGGLRLPGVPAGARSPRPRISCRSRGRSRRRTTRRRSRVGTPPCAGSPSTSSWRSSSGMVARRRQRVRDAAPEIRVDADADAAVRSAIVAAIGDARRRADRPDRRPGRRHRRHPRRPRPPDADAAPPPGRRRVGQDGGRGLRARGDRPGRASRARSSPRPTCSPASTSRRSARCSRASASASRC